MVIKLDVAVIVYAFSCFITVATAIKILWGIKKKLQAPLEEINTRLENHDKYLDNDKKHFERVDYALEDLTDSLNMLVRSNRIILEHLREGNHTGEIQTELKVLDNWLLENKRYRKD